MPRRLIFQQSAAIQNFTTILLYNAKLATGLGDKKKALLRVRTAVRIGSHFSQIETQALIGITLSIMCELSILETTFNDLLPNLGLNKKEYKEWRNAINAGHVNITLKQMSIGKFNLVTPVLMLPICEKTWLFQLTGTNNVYDTIAENHLELISLSAGNYKSYLETKKNSSSIG